MMIQLVPELFFDDKFARTRANWIYIYLFIFHLVLIFLNNFTLQKGSRAFLTRFMYTFFSLHWLKIMWPRTCSQPNEILAVRMTLLVMTTFCFTFLIKWVTDDLICLSFTLMTYLLRLGWPDSLLCVII